MTKRWTGDGDDVVERHVVTTVEQSPNLTGEDEGLQPVRAGAEADIALDVVDPGAVGMRGRHQLAGVDEYVLRDRHLPRHLLRGQVGVCVRYWRQLGEGGDGRLAG